MRSYSYHLLLSLILLAHTFLQGETLLGSSLDEFELDSKRAYLAGSIFDANQAEVVKIGLLKIDGDHSHFPDFLSEEDLAILKAKLRTRHLGESSALFNLGASRYSMLKKDWGAFSEDDFIEEALDGKFKLDFYLARDVEGNVYQAFDILTLDEKKSAAFRLRTPLTGTKTIHVRSNERDRVIRIVQIPVDQELTNEQSANAKKTLGLSNLVDWAKPGYATELSQMHFVHRTKRKILRRTGKVGMAAISGLFAYLTFQALFVRNFDTAKHAMAHVDDYFKKGKPHKHTSSCSKSGCGHGHKHVKKLTAKQKNMYYFTKFFDASVFGTAAIAWGAHAFDVHERLEDMEESNAKAFLERAFHMIELTAVALGLTKGVAALAHIGFRMSLLPADLLSREHHLLLAIANMSAEELHSIAFISTFLTCPFDEMLGMVLAFVGGAFDSHKFSEVWHRDHDHHLPAIVHFYL